jgi:hypothetical protein
MTETASSIAGSVREELFGSKEDFQDQMQQFVNQIKASAPTPERIGKELANILSETEIKMATSPDWHQSTLSFIEKEGKMNKAQAESVMSGIKSAASVVKEEANAPKGPVEKVIDTAARAMGASDKEAQSYRQKVENYLRSTGKQALNPEGIKRDIEQLITSPKAGKEALQARVASIDKSTVATLIAQRKDVSKEEAQRLVDQVDNVLKEILGKSQEAAGTAQGAQEKVQGLPEALTGKLRNYLNSLNRPELKYEGIRSDIQRLFSDPKAGAEALLARLRSMNRDTFKALLASRRDISNEDAEHIVSRMEEVRDDYIKKAEQMKDEVVRRVNAAKAEALHQVDEVRKTAATAAWWLFATSIVSAIAAVLGGMLGA